MPDERFRKVLSGSSASTPAGRRSSDSPRRLPADRRRRESYVGPRAECPVCHTLVALRTDGSLRSHRAGNLSVKNGGWPCPGPDPATSY